MRVATWNVNDVNKRLPLLLAWLDATRPYRRKRWERDAGLRIDHLLLSKALTARLVDAGVDKAVRGMEGASDHAPAWVELR